MAGAERIFEIIDTPSEAYQDPNAVPMPRIEGRVKFDDVHILDTTKVSPCFTKLTSISNRGK